MEKAPAETIERLVAERREWSRERALAELSALEPLPDENDSAWDSDDAWQRAMLLVAHADLIAANRWTDSIAIALSKMSLGDDAGELMRSAMASLAERSALAAALAEQALRTVRTVRRCGIQFRVRCPREWSALRPTDDPDVRHCDACEQPVYFCRTDAETIERAIAGECIAREEPDAAERPVIVLGRPARPEPLTARQEEAQRVREREAGIRDAIGLGVGAADPRCPSCSYPVPTWRRTCHVCGRAAR